MTTYGCYAHTVIKKVACVDCDAPLRKYNLQLLLEQPRALCPECATADKAAEAAKALRGFVPNPAVVFQPVDEAVFIEEPAEKKPRRKK